MLTFGGAKWRMKFMGRPLVLAVAGVFGVLTVLIAVSRLRPSDTPTPAFPASDHRDTAARIDPRHHSSDPRTARLPNDRAGTVSTGPDRSNPGRPHAGLGGTANRSRSGRVETVEALRRFGDHTSPADWEEAAGTAAGAHPTGGAALPPRNARSSAGRTDDAHLLVPAGDAQADEHPPLDPDAPVLSMPLATTAEPKTGEAPVAVDNVRFDPKSGAVFGTDSKVVVPDAGHINNQAGSISFWMQPEWEGSEVTDAFLADLEIPHTWRNRLRIMKNGGWLRFMFFDNTGDESGTGADITKWMPGEWHHVTANWGEPDPSGAHRLSLYVDGTEIGSNLYAGEMEYPSGGALIIGNSFVGQHGARSAITSFEVYQNPLAPDRIQSLAAQPPEP